VADANLNSILLIIHSELPSIEMYNSEYDGCNYQHNHPRVEGTNGVIVAVITGIINLGLGSKAKEYQEKGQRACL
jgi:hypothetical protein